MRRLACPMEALDQYTKEKVIDVRVDLFWVNKPQKNAHAMDMYCMMNQICDGTLQNGAGTG